MPAPTTTTTTTTTTMAPGPWITAPLNAGPIPGTTYDFTIGSLSANTIYQYRAFMVVGGNQYCGNTYEIQTLPIPVALPTVTTGSVTFITQTSAWGSGNVTADGGSSLTARGTAWGVAPNPTISGSHTYNGNTLGVFAGPMTGLTPNTTYYVRGYATNAVGTAYGSGSSFTTLVPPTTLPPATYIISAQACTDVLNFCIGGAYFLRCCDGSTYRTRVIGSPLFNVDNVIWTNVPAGCYYVDYSSVSLYLSYAQQSINGVNWSDDYMYGYSQCCTHCFLSNGNNSVYGCIY
jgi:hypothetical protein